MKKLLKYGYIYETYNRVNGKIYIGQRKGDFNPRYLGSGTILNKAIKKYGRKNFTVKIVDIAKSKTQLDKREIEHIKEWRKTWGNKIYNITEGGAGGSVKGRKLGKPSKEHREKNSLAHIGKVFSKKHRINISKAMKGKPSACGFKGKHHTLATKEKQSLASLKHDRGKCKCCVCKAVRGEYYGKKNPNYRGGK